MGSFKLTEQRVRRMELAGMNSVRDLWKVLEALNLKGTDEPKEPPIEADALSKGGKP